MVEMDRTHLVKQSKFLSWLIAVLLLNMVLPSLASISSDQGKILICTQNGFEWVSVDTKQQQYLALAKQLQLDIEQLFPDLQSQTEPSPTHGKCVLCFFSHIDLTAVTSAELTFAAVPYFTVVFSFEPQRFYTLGEYKSLQPRAPPLAQV